MSDESSVEEERRDAELGARAIDRKRFLISGLSVAAAGGLLAACGDNSSSGGGTGAGTSAAGGGGSVAAATALSKAPTAAFDPNVKAGVKPDLPRRIGWSLPAGGELFTAFDTAVRQAADSADLEYVSAQANGDSPKQFQQTQDLLSRGLGGADRGGPRTAGARAAAETGAREGRRGLLRAVRLQHLAADGRPGRARQSAGRGGGRVDRRQPRRQSEGRALQPRPHSRQQAALGRHARGAAGRRSRCRAGGGRERPGGRRQRLRADELDPAEEPRREGLDRHRQRPGRHVLGAQVRRQGRRRGAVRLRRRRAGAEGDRRRRRVQGDVRHPLRGRRVRVGQVHG